MPKMKRKDSGPAVLGSYRVRVLSPNAGACMCDGTLGGEVRVGWGWVFSQAFIPRKVKKHWLWYESYPHTQYTPAVSILFSISSMFQVVFVPVGVLSSPNPTFVSPLPSFSIVLGPDNVLFWKMKKAFLSSSHLQIPFASIPCWRLKHFQATVSWSSPGNVWVPFALGTLPGSP